MNNNTNTPYSSPMQFPCDFIIKVMGKDTAEFNHEVLSLVQSHFPTIGPEAVSTRHSNQGAYIALTVTVHANSQTELDGLYEALSANEHVIMAL